MTHQDPTPRWWLARPCEAFEPAALLALGDVARGRHFFASPTGRSFAGIGEAVALCADGEGRFHDLASAVNAQGPLLRFCGDGAPPPRPSFLGGFAFASRWRDPGISPWAGFPGARMVLPELCLEHGPQGARLVAVAPPGLDEAEARRWTNALIEGSLAALRAPRPDDEHEEQVQRRGFQRPLNGSELAFEERVREALALIGDGGLRKVTLARAELWPLNRIPGPRRLLAAMASQFPHCFHFWMQPPGSAAFVGVSPERLLSQQGTSLWTEALAGTAPRSADPDEDEAHGRWLLDNPKERREHAAVVEHIKARLDPLTLACELPDGPELRRLANVQHLHTPFRVELLPEPASAGPLKLASLLHPTPAVAGVPTLDALRWLEHAEGLERGWYAGGVGWVGPGSSGEFSVAIRSGLLLDSATWLFAGAGIVAGSDPERERAETERKLLGMKEVLLRA